MLVPREGPVIECQRVPSKRDLLFSYPGNRSYSLRQLFEIAQREGMKMVMKHERITQKELCPYECQEDCDAGKPCPFGFYPRSG